MFVYYNQLHAVSRTQHGRQREPSVKTLSAEFLNLVYYILKINIQDSRIRQEMGNGVS